MKIIKVPSKPKVKTAKEILTTLFEFLLEKEFKDIGEVSYCNSLDLVLINNSINLDKDMVLYCNVSISLQ